MTATERLCRGIIALASFLVPSVRRGGWVEEWEGEVWHHLHQWEGRDPRVWVQARLALRCLGAFPHALWIQGEEWHMDSIWQDIRYAARSLMKRPGFTAVAVCTLALGMGGNSAVFSVVNSVLLKPLPIENASRLVMAWGRNFPSGPGAAVSAPDFLDYGAGTEDVFEELAAYSAFTSTLVVDIQGQPEEVQARGVTDNLLSALGYEPAAGRSFTHDEIQSDEPSVVMLSHGLWGRMFGYAPSAVGSTIRLNGRPFTVVGVLPRELDFPGDLDLWANLSFGDPGYSARAAHFLRPLGLLRDGVTAADAQLSMDRVSARLEAAHPDTNDGWYAQLQPLHDVEVGSARPALIVLLGGVGLVLLIACGNVANLLMARAAARRGEVAVRTAMGASRLRLARQMLTESLLLATVSAVAGLALAYLGVEALKALEPGDLPRLEEVTVDGTALVFTGLMALGVGLLFGMAPAVSLGRRGDLTNPLSTMGRGGARRRGRGRDLLVAGEVALSFVLLVAAGLLSRSFVELRAVDPGFDTAGAVSLAISLPDRAFPEAEAVNAARDDMTARLAALPGVTSVGASSVLPLSGGGGDTYVYAEDRPPASVQDVANTAQIRMVDEGYFDAMGIPLRAGRAFDGSDVPGAPPRVIINQTLARDLFPDEDPVGKTIVAWPNDQQPLEVVGVAADVRQFSLGTPAFREFYLSARQTGARNLTFVVRGQNGVAPGATAVREAIRAVDPGQPVRKVTPLDSYVDGSLAQGRFQALLMALFAGLALALAAVGIYGVLAQAVGERRREMGIRIAMGAPRATVTGMVVRQGAGMALLGLAVGLLAAWGAARLLGSLLYEVGAADPLTFLVAPTFLFTVVLVSSWLPARQAARTDPAVVLREE